MTGRDYWKATLKIFGELAAKPFVKLLRSRYVMQVRKGAVLAGKSVEVAVLTGKFLQGRGMRGRKCFGEMVLWILVKLVDMIFSVVLFVSLALSVRTLYKELTKDFGEIRIDVGKLGLKEKSLKFEEDMKGAFSGLSAKIKGDSEARAMVYKHVLKKLSVARARATLSPKELSTKVATATPALSTEAATASSGPSAGSQPAIK